MKNKNKNGKVSSTKKDVKESSVHPDVAKATAVAIAEKGEHEPPQSNFVESTEAVDIPVNPAVEVTKQHAVDEEKTETKDTANTVETSGTEERTEPEDALKTEEIPETEEAEEKTENVAKSEEKTETVDVVNTEEVAKSEEKAETVEVVKTEDASETTEAESQTTSDEPVSPPIPVEVDPKKDKKAKDLAKLGKPKKKSKLLKLAKWMVFFGVVGACGYQFVVIPLQNKTQEMLSSAYLTHQVEPHEITVSVSSTGTVQPIDSYNVTASMTGDILSAPFTEGGQVTKGQTLYTFDTSSVLNSIAQAELNVEKSQLTYDQALLGTSTSSNVSGIVQTVHVQLGDSVNIGTPLAELVDNNNTTVKIPFHSIQTTTMTEGQSAILTLDHTMEQLRATLVSVSPFEEIGAGNTLLRMVEFSIPFSGGVNTTTTATASVVTEEGMVYSAGSGNFVANTTYTVVSSASGEITELNLWEGQSVNYGDVVASLGGISIDNSIENARLNLETAQLSLENTADSVDNYVITAPISGTVIEKKFDAGDSLDSSALSAAGGNMAVIYDMSTLTFIMDIHELDINKIQVGQEVHITADAVEGAEFIGYVDKININGSTSGGMTSYPVTVVLEGAEGLKPGMNVSAEVIVETVGTVLSVPVDAVKRGQSGAYVQVATPSALNANGEVGNPTNLETVYVELGVNDTDYIQVVSGLDEGDVVVWANEIVNPFASMMGPPT